MEQEYAIATRMKVTFCVLAAGILIMVLYLFSILRQGGNTWSLLFISLMLIIGSVFLFLNALRRKIVISTERILYVGLLGSKELLCSDIKGCRYAQKFIYIESASSKKANIAIRAYDDFESSGNIVAWLKENFTDLDKVDIENQHSELLDDSTLGFTKEEREDRLKKAKSVSLAYTITGCVAGFFLLFFKANFFSAGLLMIYPLLGIVVIMTSKGLIKFLSNSKRSLYGFVMPGILFPSFAFFLQALNTYNILRYDHFWMPVIIVVSIFFILLTFFGINKSAESLVGQIVCMFIASVFYGLGFVQNINCTFDHSPVTVYYATVLNHHISHGKSTTYYITLSGWGPEQVEEEETVDRKLYYNVEIGDTIDVNFKKGLLNIPWYTISK